MYIKPQSVIPAGFKVTKVAERKTPPPSLYALERRDERRLEKQAMLRLKADNYHLLRESGLSVAETISLLTKEE